MKRPSLLTVLLFLVLPNLGLAEGNIPRLTAAEDFAKAKLFSAAIQQAEPLLDELRLNTVDEIVLAHRILGASYCETGKKEKAQEHFKTLLMFSPAEPQPSLLVSPGCKQLFAAARGTPAPTPVVVETPPITKSNQTALRNEPRETPPPARPSVVSSVKSHEPSSRTWPLYVPFGSGQFLNEQATKGWLFLGSEAALTTLGITSFLLFKAEEGPDGTFENAGTAAAYRGMFWGSLGATVGLMTWGIIDAVLVHRNQPVARKPSRLRVTGTGVALQF